MSIKYILLAMFLLVPAIAGAVPAPGDYYPVGTLASVTTPQSCQLPPESGTRQPFLISPTTADGKFNLTYWDIIDGVRQEATVSTLCSDNGQGGGFTCHIPEFSIDWSMFGLDAFMYRPESTAHGASFSVGHPSKPQILFTVAPHEALKCNGLDCPVVAAMLGSTFSFDCGTVFGVVYSQE